MCSSNLASVIFTATSAPLAAKRPHSSITTPSQPGIIKNGCDGGDGGPRRKRLKRIRKSIQFSPRVNMRFYFDPQEQSREQPRDSASPSTEDEVDEAVESRKRAKELSRQWRSKNSSAALTSVADNESIIGEAVRCEMKGDSLRGFEHFTHPSIRRMRNRVQDGAVQAVMTEQQEQLVRRVLEASFSASEDGSAEDQVKKEALKMDAGKLARAYRSKAEEALTYAKRLAEEDAKVAAEILAEDLKEDPVTSQRVDCCHPAAVELLNIQRMIRAVASQRGLSDDMVHALLQNVLSRRSRQRSVAALQA